MTQDNSNSTMEMGTSDQVLVVKNTPKKLKYIVGAVTMVVVIGIVVALTIVLTGNGNEAGEAEAIVSTTGSSIPTTIVTTIPPIVTETTISSTESTTISTQSTTLSTQSTTISTQSTTLSTQSTTISTQSTSTSTQSTTTSTQPPTTEPPGPVIELEDIINGEFSVPSFNGTWVNGNKVLFRNNNGDLVLYDVDTDVTTKLVSNESQILQQSFRVTELSPDYKYVMLSYNETAVYRYSFEAQYSALDIITGDIIHIQPPGRAHSKAFLQNLIWGPSGNSLAFVYENNIYYQSSLLSALQKITTNGQNGVIYNGVPDWVYEEEVFASNNALWFSKDGSKLAYATFDDSNVRIMKVPHYGVPGSVDFQYTRHREIRYPKSGTTNPTVSVTLRNLDTSTQVVYQPPTTLEQPILKNVAFVNNDTIAVMWTNRVQTEMSIVLCTGNSNECRQIFTYSEPDGWIDSNPMIFNEQGNAFITILPQRVNNILYKQIVQISEANGLWTLSSRSNTPHTVAEIMTWTRDNVIWYKATHENDTTQQHIYLVNSTSSASCFTCAISRPDGARCLYNDATISDGGRISVNCAGPDVPMIFIYDVNGKFIRSWEDNARVTELLSAYTLPKTITMQVPLGQGLPDADVLLQVPANYENRTNVPLLVYVYGGPDTALVTRQWNLDWGSSLVSRYGIAVARIDGRGSGLRGVENMFALNRKLGTVEIEDQILVTKRLQDTLSWVDANRTCIWGWSYGGYASSLALARGGDVFRCAIAVAPVVDWRFYDTIYTERYMSTPQNNSHAYAASSLLNEQVVRAYRNKRYFLVHGTEDDNVHYQHAMLLSRLLQRQDVYFTQMSYTDEDHGLSRVRPHLHHTLEKYLRENML